MEIEGKEGKTEEEGEGCCIIICPIFAQQTAKKVQVSLSVQFASCERKGVNKLQRLAIECAELCFFPPFLSPCNIDGRQILMVNEN